MQPSRRFLHLAQITLVFLYLVIIAGSVVRATGSGMGCPDWPKCFGHWIPPMDVSQLPADYRNYFKVQNQQIAPFNALQTWTEYGNRLVGALLGLLMFAQLIVAFRNWKNNILMFRLSALVLVLTGMEGALGALVVHENLKTGVITMHMFLSLIILLVQAYIVFKSSAAQPVESEFPALKKFILASLVFTTVQILIGTQVREHVDALLKNFDANSRGDILDNTGTVFPLHAFFAWLVLAVNLFVVFRIYKDTLCRPKLQSHALLILLVLGLEIGAGEILKVFALPAIVQPIHLLIASLLFGLQWSLYLRTNSKSPHPLPS